MKKIICTVFFIFVFYFSGFVSSRADESLDDQAKLDRILTKQDQILHSLEEVKSELAILKARVTR